MKTKTLEKLLLLEQTGELSARQRRLLDACPEAQAKRDELNALCAAVLSTNAEPEPWAVAKIAARLRMERASLFKFSRLWKPVLLTMVCMMLIVNTFDFKQTAPEHTEVVMTEMDVWSSQFENDLAELESLILAISGDPLDIMEM